MAKKKKIVKPHYIPKDQRKKNKPMAKETKILILGICAAVIVAAVLFAIFYDDGSLPVRDGVVVTEGRQLDCREPGHEQQSEVLQVRRAHAAGGLYGGSGHVRQERRQRQGLLVRRGR